MSSCGIYESNYYDKKVIGLRMKRVSAGTPATRITGSRHGRGTSAITVGCSCIEDVVEEYY